MYVKFTELEKETARNVNIVDYLEKNGYRLYNSGHQKYFDEKKHIALSDSQWWYNHKEGVGGGSIDFLVKYLGMDFQKAVISLVGEENIQYLRNRDYKHNLNKPIVQKYKPSKQEEKIKNFILPEKNNTTDNVENYLINERSLDKEIVNKFIEFGKIYEEKKHNNVVFVGFDEENKPVRATLKGTKLNEKGERFRMHVKDSDCNYGFSHKGSSDKVIAFESATDMLAYISLNKNSWERNSYIALGGVTPKPLDYFLKNNETIKKVVLSLDNDIAGIKNSEKIYNKLKEQGYEVSIERSKNKDWNEDIYELVGKSFKECETTQNMKEYIKIVDELKGVESCYSIDIANDVDNCFNEFMKNDKDIGDSFKFAFSLLMDIQKQFYIHTKQDRFILDGMLNYCVKTYNEFEENSPKKINEMYKKYSSLKNGKNLDKSEANQLIFMGQKILSSSIAVTKDLIMIDKKNEIKQQNEIKEGKAMNNLKMR